jgi:AhpD family alkylhydroperoxidase
MVRPARLNYAEAAPGAYQAMVGLERYVRSTKLDRRLLHLVKMRASQINGCAFCLNLHSQEALRDGETPRRLFQLSAWEESPDFTTRERAALRWTEAITRIGEGHAPDAVYRDVRRSFREKELVDLTLAIIAINGWNRLAIGFRVPPDPSGR